MRFFIALVLLVTLLTSSCDTVTSTKTVTVEDKSVDSTKTYNIAIVNNTKDPACGMPVTAGIGDTAHYNGKVLGFCSTECKATFKKDPTALIAAAEMKK